MLLDEHFKTSVEASCDRKENAEESSTDLKNRQEFQSSI